MKTTTLENPSLRQAIRQMLRQQRRALSFDEQANHAKQLRAQLKTFAAIRSAKRIALYLSNDGEIDPVFFMRWAWATKKRCYLPVLPSRQNQAMRFAEVRADSKFCENAFSILEPIVQDYDLIKADALDVILMPLVAFDLSGNRIGMGGGFYDRTLAFRRRHPYYQRPKLIGLAHECQQQASIEPAAWDVPLDGIATEYRAQLF